MAQLTLLLMSVILILAVVAHGRTKRASFDMLDAYFLMIILFFGVYSIIGAVINGADGKDTTVVMLTFLPIFFAMIVTWLLNSVIPLKLRRLLRFVNLIEQWANVDRKTITLLAAVFFAFNGYLFFKFGMITYVGTELELLNISIPTWIGPVKVLMNYIGFSCYVAIVSSMIKGRTRIVSLDSLLMLALMIALSLEGRRAVIELMLIAFILWSCFRRKSVYSFRHVPYVIIMFVAFIFLSNMFQTYRVEVLSIRPTVDSRDVTSLSAAVVNIDATIENYRERSAMWNYNYMITDEQLKSPFKVFWGALAWQALLNSVPRVVWNSKKVIDMDAMVAELYEFEVTDYSSNNFASFMADFGILMIFLLPMVNIFVLFLASYYCSVTQNSILVLLVPVFCLEYLIKIENAYGDIFILLINIFLFTVLCLIARVLRHICRAGHPSSTVVTRSS